jgi:hypothetical protein
MVAPGPACPRCQNTNCTKPSYTWWGGFLGPKIINHVKCARCGFAFNPTTGNAITGAIIIYSVIVGAIAFALVFALLRH